jgi:hypothetical protein
MKPADSLIINSRPKSEVELRGGRSARFTLGFYAGITFDIVRWRT